MLEIQFVFWVYKMKNLFLSYLNRYDSICIFRHTNPDGDALGSQFGLKQWIVDNFPDKKVYALGQETGNYECYTKMDEASDESIASSLAIAVDCANLERIDDNRISLCKEILKIDHHPNNDPYGKDNIVDTSSAACSQLLVELLKEIDNSVISKLCAVHFYRGILTDSLCFKTSSTTSKTLEIGSYLANKGIDIPAINRELFDISLKDYQLRTLTRSKLTIIDKFGYVLYTLEDLKNNDITGSIARNTVSEINGIKDLEIVAIFNERLSSSGQIKYEGSLRSKQVTINDIAEKYYGGGHKNASGVKGMTKAEFEQILLDLQAKSLNM